MRLQTLAGLVCCVGLTAFCQSPLPLTNTRPVSLAQCIELAVSKNLDVRIEHAAAEMASDNLTGAYGPYIPVFSFNASHRYISDPADFDARKFNPYFPVELNNDTLGPGLTGQLPIGLSYGFSSTLLEENARTDFRSDPENAAFFPAGIRQTNNYVADARVTLRQHLLKDFWIDSARATIRIRRKDVSISEQAVRFQVMQTVLAVEVGYYDLLAAREQVHVQEEALALAQQFLRETRRRVEVGDLPPLDKEQAETQLQNTLTMLSAARESAAIRENTLKKLLTDNFLEWAEARLELTDSLLATPTELNRSASFQSALKNRPDLIEARLAVEQRAVMVRFQQNQLFPSLDVVGHYGGLGVDPDWGTALNQAYGLGNPDYFYGMVLSLPLSSVAERGNYRASKAAKQIAELQLKKAEQEVLVEVANDISRVESRYSQIGSTRQARIFAEAALAAEQKKLQNGLSTAFFVLQLQQTLTQARMTETQALADYNKARAQLAFAQGSLLEQHRVAVEAN
jgi:outer membrane protein TolC